MPILKAIFGKLKQLNSICLDKDKNLQQLCGQFKIRTQSASQQVIAATVLTKAVA